MPGFVKLVCIYTDLEVVEEAAAHPYLEVVVKGDWCSVVGFLNERKEFEY